MGEGKLNIELQCATLPEAIEYAVDTLRGACEKKGVGLTFNISAELPPAYADPMRLRQIMTILLDNAVKFTPAGGAVHAQATLSEVSPGFLLVEVSDSGPGIGAEAAHRIFDRLYQAGDPSLAGRRGLGLGLHIARGLVKRQGGNIWVVSEPGKGCRFFFTVPVFGDQADGPRRDAELETAETVGDGHR